MAPWTATNGDISYNSWPWQVSGTYSYNPLMHLSCCKHSCKQPSVVTSRCWQPCSMQSPLYTLKLHKNNVFLVHLNLIPELPYLKDERVNNVSTTTKGTLYFTRLLSHKLTSWKISEQRNQTLGQRHFQIILKYPKRSKLD